MDVFTNYFVQYDGISQNLPSEVTCFKTITHPFFVDLPDDMSLHTLNRVSVRVHDCITSSTIQKWSFKQGDAVGIPLPLHCKVEVTVYYTIDDLLHSVHSSTQHVSLLELLYYPHSYHSNKPLKPRLYVEDIFAQALDPKHIYGYIVFLANLPLFI